MIETGRQTDNQGDMGGGGGGGITNETRMCLVRARREGGRGKTVSV